MKVLLISRPTLFSAPGGDTVQIKETARELIKLGVEAEVSLADEEIDYSSYDLLHFFNIIRPNTISGHVKKSKLPFVISTIFVDYSEIEKSERGLLFRVLANTFGADGTDYFKTIGRFIFNREKIIDLSYLFKGHKKSVEELLNAAHILLPNSDNEFRRLKERYHFRNTYIKVPNGVSKDFIRESLIQTKRKGVVCIGRIEFVKNQLNLIRAIDGTDISLKIIGQPAPNHKAYYEQCKREATDNIEFIGHISKAEVIEELDRTKVHVLPSWFETTGLSSLEAAVRRCNVVITKKGDTEEYFEDYAFYCEPDSPKSIREAIKKALAEEVNPKLNEFISKRYTWEVAAQKTLEAYQKVLDS
ncbi:MAG: glycosyltransferase involved in cell wall biosynthesis [Vicingaceae bacterium]|jgi:glycosyltransferase involved in cell wall biosynthesis